MIRDRERQEMETLFFFAKNEKDYGIFGTVFAKITLYYCTLYHPVMRSEFEILLRKNLSFYLYRTVQESTAHYSIGTVRYGRCAGSTLIRLQ